MNAIIREIAENLDVDMMCPTAADLRRIRHALEDGAALAEMGLTDDDQTAVEDAHAEVLQLEQAAA